MNEQISSKSRLATLLFCLFLGILGAHRFYVGKIWTGVLTIVTFGGFFGIWPLIDLVMIVIGAFKDKEGNGIKNW